MAQAFRKELFFQLPEASLNSFACESDFTNLPHSILALHFTLLELEQTGCTKDGLVSFRERSQLIFCIESLLFSFYQHEHKIENEHTFLLLKRRLSTNLSPNRPRPLQLQSISRTALAILFQGLLCESLSYISYLVIEYYLIDSLFILILEDKFSIENLRLIPQASIFKSMLTLLGLVAKENQTLGRRLSKSLSELLTSDTKAIGHYLLAAGVFDPSQPQELSLQMVKVACTPPTAFAGDYLSFLAESIATIVNSSQTGKEGSAFFPTFLEKTLVLFALALTMEEFSVNFIRKIESKCPKFPALAMQALSGSFAAGLSSENLSHAASLLKDLMR